MSILNNCIGCAEYLGTDRAHCTKYFYEVSCGGRCIHFKPNGRTRAVTVNVEEPPVVQDTGELLVFAAPTHVSEPEFSGGGGSFGGAGASDSWGDSCASGE